MPDRPQQITLEEAISGVLSPWFDGKDLTAGDKAPTARDAAAKALVAALNVNDERGVVRVLVTSAEQKRDVHNYLTAFLSDAPQLKKLVRKMAVDAFHLNGGVSIVIDLNSARLVKGVIAQIVLDLSVGEPIGSVWLEVDGNNMETKEAAAVRRGYRIEDVPNLRFVRWMTDGEAAAAMPILHPLDAHDEPGPPKEVGPDLVPDPDRLIEQKLKRRQAEQEAEAKYHAAVEARRREETAQKISDHFNRIKQRGV